MPTLIGHAVVGWATAQNGLHRKSRYEIRAVAFVAALLAMLPDVDVIAFGLGIPYAAKLGHRGFTHSLTFALASALIGHACIRWQLWRKGHDAPGILAFLLLFLAAASHPLLDMLTDGGLGVALLAPFSWTRFFFPLRPIPVSAIGVDGETGYVLAWEAAVLSPLALAAILPNGTGRSRRFARWLGLAVTLAVCTLRVAWLV
jgi:inner membrane protein